MAIISVKVSSVAGSNNVLIEDTTTVRQVPEDNGINYETANTALDGATLPAGPMDKTSDGA